MYYKTVLSLLFLVLLNACGGNNNDNTNILEEKPQLPKEDDSPVIPKEDDPPAVPKEDDPPVVPKEDDPPAVQPPDLTNAEVLTTYYTYDFSTPPHDEYEPESSHLLNSSFKHSIEDGFLYVSINSDVPFDSPLDQYIFGFSYPISQKITNLIKDETFITDSNTYLSDYSSEKKETFRTEKIIKNELGKLFISPNTTFNNNIIVEKTLQWFDLSGMPMTEKTNVGQVQLINDPLTSFVFDFIEEDVDWVFEDGPSLDKYASRVHKLTNLQKKHIFPKGSKCFVFSEVVPNKSFIKFNHNLISEKKSFNDVYLDNHPIQGNLSGISFKFNQKSLPQPNYFGNYGWILFQSKLFEAVLASNWSLKDLIKEKEKYISSHKAGDGLSKDDIKIMDYYYDVLTQGCYGYNAIAANALNEIINEAEK